MGWGGRLNDAKLQYEVSEWYVACGRVGELVSQRIFIAKTLKTIIIFSQIPATKLFFLDKEWDRLVLI